MSSRSLAVNPRVKENEFASGRLATLIRKKISSLQTVVNPNDLSVCFHPEQNWIYAEGLHIESGIAKDQSIGMKIKLDPKLVYRLGILRRPTTAGLSSAQGSRPPVSEAGYAGQQEDGSSQQQDLRSPQGGRLTGSCPTEAGLRSQLTGTPRGMGFQSMFDRLSGWQPDLALAADKRTAWRRFAVGVERPTGNGSIVNGVDTFDCWATLARPGETNIPIFPVRKNTGGH